MLHLNGNDLTKALILLKKALIKEGVIYASFKYGEFEGIRNGRYFNDMTIEKIKPYINNAGLYIAETYISEDVRQGRENEKWLNLILKAN